MDQKILKTDERAAFALRSLYRRFGYCRYKMSKFEEYALYIRNKDFLVSDGIISFTDTNGRLLALKPDVTLSIINNSHDEAGSVQKLYYDENVYRISKSSHSYKEIKQTGLECIGDVGLFEVCEVVMLAVSSLKTISDDFILELSHVGVMQSELKKLELDPAAEKKILDCISRKSVDELYEVCKQYSVSDDTYAKLAVFSGNYHTVTEAVKALEAVCEGEQFDEFKAVAEFLVSYGISENVRVDFSLTNDMTYYSGIAFKGYIKDIPVSVLSGGQYDKLMRNMGRNSGAIGFAVYLDALERLGFEDKEYDVDIVLLHGGDTVSALRTAELLSSQGNTVRVCASVPADIKYRQVIEVAKEEK